MSLRATASPGQYLTGKINKVTFQIITAYGVAVKNGFKGTEQEWLDSLIANPSLIETYVKEYLTENPVATDATLSIVGMAADAKATGDAIQNAKPDWAQTDPNKPNYIKNKPDLSGIERAQSLAENALPKSGGTISGDLYIGSETNTAQLALYIMRVVSGALKSGRLYWSDGNLRLQAASAGSEFNYMDLKPGSTEFKKPVSVSSGGTGHDFSNIPACAILRNSSDNTGIWYTPTKGGAFYATGDNALPKFGTLPIEYGGTGAVNADAALANLGGLSKAGGTMTGPIAMGGKKITGLGTPSSSADAATKAYVDGKRLSGTVTLSASGWSSGVQTVSVSGILATDMPHWGCVYGTNKEAEKEAFALVDVLETSAGKFTFRCFGDVPSVALTIQWEVNR